MRGENSITIKKTGKKSDVAVRDREEYLAEAKRNLMMREITKNSEETLMALLTKFYKRERDK